MKVLQVIASLRTGGAEKLVVDLVTRLKEQSIESDILIFDGIPTHLLEIAKERGIRIFTLGKGGSVYSIYRLVRLLPYLKKYDIIHTHLTAPQYFASFWNVCKKFRLVTTEHNSSNRRRKWRLFKLIDKWIYKNYNYIVCVSEKTKMNLLKHIGNIKNNIVTINNGIENFSFCRQTAELENIAPFSRKIIMVAGFRREKDQESVVRAMDNLPPHFHLFLVGEGYRKEHVDKLVKELDLDDRIHFLGERSDVGSLLKSADYVVMSSHFEGLSLSSVEGLSVGKPFIASDVDGLREVVKGAGVLFPHEDDKALAEEILKLEASEHYYNQVAQACYKRAQDYDISKMVDAYADVYRRMMEE